jgi:hypothetical protein
LKEIKRPNAISPFDTNMASISRISALSTLDGKDENELEEGRLQSDSEGFGEFGGTKAKSRALKAQAKLSDTTRNMTREELVGALIRAREELAAERLRTGKDASVQQDRGPSTGAAVVGVDHLSRGLGRLFSTGTRSASTGIAPPAYDDLT